MVNTKGCVQLLKKILNLRKDLPIRFNNKIASIFTSLLGDFLEDREFQVLDWHFGLYGEQLTLRKIGERLMLTQERVRQIEKKAINTKLWSHRDRRWFFKLFVLDKADLIQEILSLRAKSEELEKEIIKLKSPVGYGAFLATPIEDLGLSVRTTNCLRREGIEFAGEFVLKTKEELSRLRMMGRKSLEEIEDFFTEYGLEFRK